MLSDVDVIFNVKYLLSTDMCVSVSKAAFSIGPRVKITTISQFPEINH